MKKNSAIVQSLLFGVLFTLFDLIFEYFYAGAINPWRSLVYFVGGCGIGYFIFKMNRNSKKDKNTKE